MSNYPDHYTPDDIGQIEQIKTWLAERDYKQAALARLARVAQATLSQILNGSYATSPSPQLVKIVNAVRHADDTAADALAPVETSVFRLALTACQMARRYRNFAVLSAFVGTGKTFAVKHYQRTTPNTYLIEATPTMTVQSLIKLLARIVAGYEGRGSIDDKFRAIVASLQNTDSLLIVDEADTLTPHVLHTLRRLRDLANIGIVLAGTEHLTGLIRPAHGQFDQIRSRTGFWPETIKGITADDAGALVQAAFGDEDVSDEVVKRLFSYSKGSARMLIEGLVAAIQQFRSGRELNVALVDAVAKQALCLQSVA
ncbi:AAA family ATPase [Methylomonas sp. MS20]|uniref:AAA family ATPase n=1 Tax=unclassified Methylomonas TaxID=2608980 RepID=UPI0028A55288|nr:AAA family ATPase [Methylomonas sp. MV1]MDT4328524.1 AAA family ATPase [Methylomonas sp. MV1]